MMNTTPASSPTLPDPSQPIVSPASVTNNANTDIEQHYTLLNRIGEPGQFGYAVIGEKHTDKQRYAIKVVNKNKFPSIQQRQLHYKELQTEINLLKQLQNKYIIKFFETYETCDTLYIVTELCTGGELFDEIKALGNYNELAASKVLQQCISGLAYLHQHNIAHCDLKPDNFLFSDKSVQRLIKIIDFGMSKHLEKRRFLHTLRGTPYYIAPEVILGKYEFSADMWSIGVVMFVMLFGYPPFSADSDDEIFRQVLAGFQPVTKRGYKAHFPNDIPCSDSAKDLMMKLLTSDTAARLTADEALLHPWLLGETCSTEAIAHVVLDNLRSFTANTKLKTKLLKMMSDKLTADDLQSIKTQFEHIDQNHDGKISLDELKAVLERDDNTLDNKELELLWKNADIDGDGVLSYNELVTLTVQHRLQAKQERLYALFHRVDINGDGKINVSELQQALQTDHADALEMIHETDKDADDTIDFDEFVDMFMNKKIAQVEKTLNLPLSPKRKFEQMSAEQKEQVHNDPNTTNNRRKRTGKDCTVQ